MPHTHTTHTHTHHTTTSFLFPSFLFPSPPSGRCRRARNEVSDEGMERHNTHHHTPLAGYKETQRPHLFSKVKAGEAREEERKHTPHSHPTLLFGDREGQEEKGGRFQTKQRKDTHTTTTHTPSLLPGLVVPPKFFKVKNSTSILLLKTCEEVLQQTSFTFIAKQSHHQGKRAGREMRIRGFETSFQILPLFGVLVFLGSHALQAVLPPR